jgi:hypothetical protein
MLTQAGHPDRIMSTSIRSKPCALASVLIRRLVKLSIQPVLNPPHRFLCQATSASFATAIRFHTRQGYIAVPAPLWLDGVEECAGSYLGGQRAVPAVLIKATSVDVLIFFTRVAQKYPNLPKSLCRAGRGPKDGASQPSTGGRLPWLRDGYTDWRLQTKAQCPGRLTCERRSC